MSEVYRIGIDLGGTRIKTGLVSKGKILTSDIFDVGSNEALKSVLPELVEKIIRLSGKNKDKIQGIGVAFPGIVDSDKNRVIDTSAKYTDAPAVDWVKWAKETFDLPLKMDNDARLACLGEWHYGAGKGVSDMIMLTLGTGIGTAAVIDGKLLRGKHFQAGILGGHMVIDYKNKENRCSCGRYGCLEAAASMWMIENMAGRHSLFRKSLLADTGRVRWQDILRLADRGDKLSELLKLHCLEVWAIGLVNLVHAYDPERIVIGGGISHAEDLILPYFKEFLEKRSWCPGGIPEIRTAQFPDTAALLGAASLFDQKED